jgi:hypothetical protein
LLLLLLLLLLVIVLKQVRIILNKSDQVDQQQLMRVYGALMWSLGKVFKSPEVCKVRKRAANTALFICYTVEHRLFSR